MFDDESEGESFDRGRRDFIKYSGGLMGGALTANALSNLGLGEAVKAEDIDGDNDEVKPVLPEAVKARIDARLPELDWPLNGAQVFAKACAEEDLTAQFLVPGNYAVTHALADEGIITIAGRDERSMAHAADGFIRASCEVAICSGTEGPGFTNMITGIAQAQAARTPLFAIASNRDIRGDDTEAGIQDMQQQPVTEEIRKYGKRLTNSSRIWEYTAYAFRHLKNNEPGVVHLDFPDEVVNQEFSGPEEQKRSWGKEKYRASAKSHPSPKYIEEAAELLREARKPIIVASTGVHYDKAWDPLKEIAEKGDIPVAQSGPVLGHFPNDHDLSACLSAEVYPEADLVMYVGQYCMPPEEEPGFLAEKAHNFSDEAKRIQIEPDAEKIGRNIPVDAGIPSDEKPALEALAQEIPDMNNRSWVNEIKSAKKKFEEENEEIYNEYRNFREAIHPAVIAKQLSDFIYEDDLPKEQTTLVTGGYGINLYARRWSRAYRPGQLIMAPYQYGTIGSAMGVALGAGTAVKEGIGIQNKVKGAPTICVTSDGSFGLSGFSIETMAKYRLPIIVIVYNNDAWGTFMDVHEDPVKEHMHLMQKNLRYDKMAEALGAHGEYVEDPLEFMPALRRSYQIAENENIPSVINCQGKKEFWLRDEYPPGFIGGLQPGIMTLSH